MAGYLIMLSATFFLTWIIKRNKDNGVGRIENWVLLLTLIFGLAFFIGYRYNMGTDYWSYVDMFHRYKEYSWGEIFSLKEPGIKAIIKLSSYVTDIQPFYMFLCALICVGVPLSVIYKHSNNIMFSMVIYICVALLSQTNALRQAVAMAIVFGGYPYIRKKCFWKFLIFPLIGMLFHNSAIFAIPLYFIYASKPSWPTTLLIILITIFMSLSYDLLANAVEFFRESEYSETEYSGTSVNLIRIAVMIIPMILVLPFDKFLLRKNALPFNMLLANACVYVSMANSAYFARLGMFTDMFLCMAIPEIIANYGEKDRGAITYITGIYYFIYFAATVFMGYKMYPYVFILSVL